MQILYSYLFAVILSELHEKPRRKDWVTGKVHGRICLSRINFLAAGPPSYVIFTGFFFVCSFLLVYSNFKRKIFLLLKKMVGGLVPPLSPQCLRSCQILTINGKFQSLHLIKIQQHNHKNKESYHHEQIHLLTTEKQTLMIEKSS